MRLRAAGLVDSARSDSSDRPFRTMPRIGISRELQHHDCHRHVVQRSEAGARHDHRVEIARLGQVEHRITPAQRHHHAARSFHDDRVTRRGAIALIRASIASGSSVTPARSAATAGASASGSCRRGCARTLCSPDARASTSESDGSPAFDARLGRLESDRAHAAGAKRSDQRRSNDRLTDAGVGSGYEQITHRTAPR